VVEPLPAELLASWTSRASTRSGAQLCIRPLRPDDREREIEFINSLSERSRYFRLMTPLKFLPPHLLDRLMDIDYDQRMAFVATIEHEGREQFVGIARYAETDRANCVELGITVTDGWQRHGIARLLVAELTRFARWRGIRCLEGIVLPDNLPMIELAKSLGFHATHDYAQQVVVITKSLDSGQ
jgi:Acetyltransferases, including N-acetylases of ribosomal proteins